jgi:hypothetical protein
MPWKASSVMGERLRFVEYVLDRPFQDRPVIPKLGAGRHDPGTSSSTP